MSILLELLLVYMLYRFVAGFLVPLYRASRQMRQQFRDMNGRPPAGGPTPNSPNSAATPPGERETTPKSGTGKVGEYIDFEEVK